MQVTGDKGWAMLEDTAEPKRVRVGRAGQEGEEVIEVGYERDDMFREEHEMFVGCMKGEREPETSAAAALVVQRMILLGTESWQTGLPVRFPDAKM